MTKPPCGTGIRPARFICEAPRAHKAKDHVMKQYPILFSGFMVRALLAGHKTQTRRIGTKTPYQKGDRLWVRESCATWEGCRRDVVYRADTSDYEWNKIKHDKNHGAPWKLRPSIHMPKWASRLTLCVTDVRVQHLQDISESDAMAEGCERYWFAGTGEEVYLLGPYGAFGTPRHPVRHLWDDLYEKRGFGWEKNPQVTVIMFETQHSKEGTNL